MTRRRLIPGLMMVVCGTVAPVWTAGVGPSALAQAAKPEQAAGVESLPIKSITLYRSGVGYFERRGLVEGDRTVQLRFATDQINDILKSMVILIDPDGGRVASVGYGSKEPLDRRLASFGVNIGDNPTAGEILNRLRGSPVKLMTEEGEISGTIMNVEKRPTVLAGSDKGGGGAQTVADLPWINLVTPKGVQSVNLTRVRGFEILDKALAGELNKALAALAEHRAERVKSVDVAFANQGAKPVVVAYVHEMPVWKTSYRLVLPEAAEGKKDAGTPTIQGWAMVENTTDEDWQDVRLSLVAGRPVSFQMDLYEPLHVARPQVPVPTVPGVMPRIYAGGADFERAKELAVISDAAAKRGEAMTRGRAPGAPPARAQAPTESGAAFEDRDGFGLGQLGNYAAQAQAQAGEIGEVFQYQLKSPVSIARQRSAMLPILSAPIEGKRVSIYSRADGSAHPMRGVHLTNTSGLQLMPGPISVFDGSAYAGDAQIGHVSTGDKRLLAYAVDLDVQALVKEDGTSAIRKVRIVNGLIEQTFKQEATTQYAFANKDQKRPRTVLVEHAKLPGWTLAAPKKATEETEQVYRFEVELGAKESGTLEVTLERIEQQWVEVVTYDMRTLVSYAREGKVSQKVVDAVKKAADLQAAISATQKRIAQLDEERRTIEQDQARIRQNMGTVSRDTDLYKRYATKLNEQETRLEAMREQRDKEQQTLTTQIAERDAYVGGLNVE
ncbi:MAG: hypothetical protein JNM80_06175 [Phycisphaerae bacterium]|nr:hypothetical protein [Phycisphaerae bacterium]